MQEMLKNEVGATMVEYALLVALIAAVAAVGATTLGGDLSARFTALAGLIAP